jgi:hypothetical protein
MSSNSNLPDPLSFLKTAMRAVPATKYALAVGGVIAVVAIVVGFKVNLWVATLGAVIMLVLMTVFVIFASLAVQQKDAFRYPILFFTWSCLILIMATAVGVFSSAFWGWPLNFVLWQADSPKASLLDKIGDIERNKPSPDNAWTAYEEDFSRLAGVTLEYLHYIEGNPGADPGDKIIIALKQTSEKVRDRNKDQTHWFEKPPESDYHSKTLPEIYINLLQKIHDDKRNLSPEREVCYEAAIRRWLVDAWFDDPETQTLLADTGFEGSKPNLSPGCRAELKIQPNLP